MRGAPSSGCSEQTAVDQPAARAEHGGGGRQQPVLRLRQRPHVAWPLEMRHVGMAADRAGGAARRVQQHGVERLGGSPRRRHRPAPSRPAGASAADSPGAAPAAPGHAPPRPPTRRWRQAAPSCRRVRRTDRPRARPAARRAAWPAGRRRRPAPRTRPDRSRRISVTRVPAGNRTEPVGNECPPAGSGASGRGVTSSGASCWWAMAIARACLTPGRPEPGRRIQAWSVQIGERRGARPPPRDAARR